MDNKKLKDFYDELYCIHKNYFSDRSFMEFIRMFITGEHECNVSNEEFIEHIRLYFEQYLGLLTYRIKKDNKNEEDNNMDKNTVYKKAFDLIKEAVDWGMEDGEKEFVNYVAGVVELADELLDEDKETKDKRVSTDNME